MLHCKLVHVYEYVPSMRLTKKCHYYDENENLGCTIGDWHPLAAEKILALGIIYKYRDISNLDITSFFK